MAYLVRAINRENWPEPDELDEINDLQSDALNDLKTTENTISVWLANDVDDINNALIAYLGSLDKKVKDPVDVVFIDEKDLAEAGLDIRKEPNFTNIKGFNEKHRDITNLDYKSIGILANVIIKSFEKENSKIYSDVEIRELFINSIRDQLISSNDIDKSRYGSLKKYIVELEREISA